MQAATQANSPTDSKRTLALVIGYHLGCFALLAMIFALESFLVFLLLYLALYFPDRPGSLLNSKLPKRNFNQREWPVWLIGAGLCAIAGFSISHHFWPDDPFQWMAMMLGGIAFWALGFLMVRDLRFVLRNRRAAH